MLFSTPQRNTRRLAWFNFLYGLRFYAVIAILYFAHVTHSYALGISIFSIVQVMRAVLEIPTGIYSDRLGRGNCLRIGALASTLSIIFYALGQSYLVLVIGAILEGTCQAFFSGNNDALLYDTLVEAGQRDQYPEALGKVHSTLELAGFIASLLSGLIATVSFSLLLWISVLPQFGTLLISFQFREPKRPGEKSNTVASHLREAVACYVHNARLRYLSIANIIGIGVGESAWSLQAAFYNTVLPVWAVGAVLSLNFLASTISYRLSGRIINRFKALNILIFQEVYSRAVDTIALAHPTGLSPFLMAVASVLYGPGVIAQNTLLQREFTDTQRATMASINSLVGSCCFAVVGIFLGLLADRVGSARALLFAQLCSLPVLLLYLKVYRKKVDVAVSGNTQS